MHLTRVRFDCVNMSDGSYAPSSATTSRGSELRVELLQCTWRFMVLSNPKP